jgi:hypothetical protein
MKTINKILETAIIVTLEVRGVELYALTKKLDHLSSGIAEYEGLKFQADMLEFEGKSSEAEIIRAVAQSKLEALAIDYKMAIFDSKSAAFGWALRRPLITKNPMYESIREYLEGKK